MSKKEKAICALADDFQAMIAIVPKLNNFIKVHKEIAAGYQKYRKNGGEAISGIEKHLGIKKPEKTGEAKVKAVVSAAEVKVREEGAAVKKVSKKAKK